MLKAGVGVGFTTVTVIGITVAPGRRAYLDPAVALLTGVRRSIVQIADIGAAVAVHGVRKDIGFATVGHAAGAVHKAGIAFQATGITFAYRIGVGTAGAHLTRGTAVGDIVVKIAGAGAFVVSGIAIEFT